MKHGFLPAIEEQTNIHQMIDTIECHPSFAPKANRPSHIKLVFFAVCSCTPGDPAEPGTWSSSSSFVPGSEASYSSVLDFARIVASH
jgi:hypothetical protein